MAEPVQKSKLIRMRNVALAIAGIAVLPLAYSYMIDFARRDPFADRAEERSSTSAKAMELENVDIRHYREGKLITKANAGKLEISTDRQRFDLFDITNGSYRTDKGGNVEFDAAEALWSQPLKTLYVRKAAQVKDKNVNLKTNEVTFDHMKGTLQAPGKISGKLHDGNVQAVRFEYNSNTGGFKVGKTKWVGNLNLSVQGGGEGQTPTRWEIEGDETERDPKAGTDTFTNGTAADGEIILKAPKVVREIKTDIVTGTGGVLYFSPEANLYADKVVVYRKEKRAVLTGNVRMLVKPEDQQDQPAKVEEIPLFQLLKVEDVNVKPAGAAMSEAEKKALDELRSSASMRRYPTKIHAQEIEYFYGKGSRKANIKGNPQARQDFTDGLWRHVWADHAFYDGEKDTLTLFKGSGEKDKARMKNSIGDDYAANEFRTSTKKDDETFKGIVMKAIYYQLGEDETGRGTGGGAGTTGGTTGGTATGGGR